MKQLIYIVLILFLFSCASIEKRKYRDGYHIEWASKKDLDLHKTNKVQLKEISVDGKPQHLKLIANADASEINCVDATMQKKSIARAFQSDTLPKKKPNKKHDGPMKDDDRRDVGKREPKVNSWALVGFVFAVFAFSLVLFNTLLSFIPAVFSIVFSALGLKGGYKGRGFAVAGIIISFLSILLLLFIAGLL